MRWAITGAGMVTSIGVNRKSCFDALCLGVSGAKPLKIFNRDHYRIRYSYEIDDRLFEDDCTLRATNWLCVAVNQALVEAGLNSSDARTIPAFIGTGLRELRSLELWWTERHRFSVDELHFGGALRRRARIQGPSFTFSNACAASNFALGVAADTLALGQSEVAVVAGCDALAEAMVGLADRANSIPPDRLQPFDRDRRGVLLGEGSAAIVLETEGHARARGARVLGWLRGVGMTCDAHHETAPSFDGVRDAMIDALSRSGLSPEQVGILMAHGTGTALNDENEIRAFRSVFGAAAPKVSITGIKSMTGHTSGGSALVGLVTAVEALSQKRIPPTVGLDNVFPEGDGLDFIMGTARDTTARIAQINAFGFGGVNAVSIVEGANP